ncbi:DUF5753 domain-containing protein [Streptomyces koyangensis]|uniref:Transcriptional regulator n=1 Tax=Streptomyces koyangensis TaxID=188770 RepID=A0ABX7EDS1_9ACTN|nr:DUF5753 domain-containing protein [Streptomyces koyangensis]QRF02319.1 transcriptional regulator [Streptomyces koyangensis]
MSAPTVRRRRLGAKMRGLRGDLTLDDVVEASGGRFNVAKLSRLETAKSAAKQKDVEDLLDLYAHLGREVDTELRSALVTLSREGAKRGWWHSYRGVLTPMYEDLISLEAEASTIRTWQVATVPGLLQTAEYAGETITSTAMSSAIADRVSALVEIRLARQSVLTSRQEPLNLWAIISETALHTRTTEPAVMREQLSRLSRMASLPNVTIQVMPSEAAPHVGQTGSFTILGFGGHSDLDVVHLESLTNALYVEDGPQVATYAEAFERLRAAALPVERSLDLIAEAREQT